MKLIVVVLVTWFLAAPTSTHSAEEKEDLAAKIIDKIVAAYGGDRLTKLSGYSIDDIFLSPTIGQSHSPELLEIGESSQSLRVDLNAGKASLDSWGVGRTGGFQGSTISNGERAYSINFQAGTYGEAASADLYAFAGGTMRTSDTILAYELNKARDKVELLDDENYLNRTHHVLKMPFPLSADLHLYVDAQTSLISRMVRSNPVAGKLDYVYSGHTTKDGITTASRTSFFIAGDLNLVSVKHELTFNPDFPADTFTLPKDLEEQGERIDGEVMTVNKISKSAYHLGQNGGYSLFVDTAMGTIAAGGYAGLSERFDRYKKDSGNFKPLSFQVVTHHHSDHIGGLGEAHGLGATLVTVDENIATIKESLADDIQARFIEVKGRMSLGSGKRVDIYDVSTSHAKSFLLTYVPADKLIFIADHFGSQFVSGTPTANQGSVDMLAAIDGLGLDVKRIATAHSARIFTMKDLRTSVANFQPVVCSGGRPVCR